MSSGDEALDKKLKAGFDKLIAEARSKRCPSFASAQRPKNNSPTTSGSNGQQELQAFSRSAASPLLTNDGTGATSPKDPLGLGSQGPSPISHQSSQSTVGLSQPSEISAMMDRPVANSGPGSRQTPYAAHTIGSGYSAEMTAEPRLPAPPSSIDNNSNRPPIAPRQTKRKEKRSAKTVTGPKRARKPTTDVDHTSTRRSGRSIVGPWTCQVCTYYNEERPHSGIGQKVPILLHKSGGVSSPSLAKEAENSSLR